MNTMKTLQQPEITFGGYPYTREQRLWWTSPHNPECPLSRFIGNAEAIRRLQRAAFNALGRHNHCCADFSFAIYGPASTGKTTLAKLFAETLLLPFVEVEPQSIRRVHDVFEAIRKECAKPQIIDGVSYDLSLRDFGNNTYILPPMIVFIDEVHNLREQVVQGMLKATEPKDRMMVTEEGYSVDTTNVCFMIATTERGEIFDAFDTRFQKISLRLYSKAEMAQIIKMNNPDFSDKTCEIVAKYCTHVPREALAFAKDMRIEADMSMTRTTWAEVAQRVAKDHGIDEHGMTYQRLDILKALGRSPMSAAQLPFVAQAKEAELQRFILPPLQAVTPDQPMPLITVSSKGYTITPAGLAELDKRGIPNLGIRAMPEQTRQTFEALMGQSDKRVNYPADQN